jgi:hypothetical protein
MSEIFSGQLANYVLNVPSRRVFVAIPAGAPFVLWMGNRHTLKCIRLVAREAERQRPHSTVAPSRVSVKV